MIWFYILLLGPYSLDSKKYISGLITLKSVNNYFFENIVNVHSIIKFQ